MCDRLVGKDGGRVAGVLEKQRDGREEGTKEIINANVKQEEQEIEAEQNVTVLAFHI